MNTIRRLTNIASAATIAATLTACGSQTEAPQGRASAITDGCSQTVPKLVENQQFSPAEARLSGVPRSVAIKLNPVDDTTRSTPYFRTAIDGMAPEGQTQDLSGVTDVFYSKSTVDGSRPGDALQAGAVVLRTYPESDSAPLSEVMFKQFPERALAVTVGQFQAALTWDDPDDTGTRAHRITWRDGRQDYVLIAVRDPEAMVALARSVVCP
ncbi:hypothetical protein FB382_002467 [Nocardioides ginsengisegetis]|uniref:Uncharacterized protein n=1 Tax=Nocardioides ginsengisegetis TaxID=661491 RepID=A0A7W3PA66_9ACTN|nr:hypothetical protein [Nocardioides ginsengisegetis]MBA8804176.1 hypothetical protein [Nocardioides ginsengisegetis]